MPGLRDARLRQLARLFAGLRRGEEVARDVARRQAALAPDAGLARALLLQSRQEALHAGAFGAALLLTAPRERCPQPLAQALGRFCAQLDADLDAGRLAASLVGLQGLLEGLGAVALRPPSGELACLGVRCLPLRGLLLQQEEAHHQLGCRWVTRLAAAQDPPAQRALRQSCRDYADLGEAVATASVAIFDGLDLDPRDYLEAARRETDAVRGGALFDAGGPAAQALPPGRGR